MSNSGYRSLCLCKDHDGRSSPTLVHKLVCLTFHGPKPTTALTSGRWEVRHLDDNRFNNAASNLAWGTSKQNAADKILHNKSPKGETNPTAKFTEETVKQVLDAWNKGNTVAAISTVFKVSPTQVTNMISARQWKHVHADAPTVEWRPVPLPGLDNYLVTQDGKLRRVCNGTTDPSKSYQRRSGYQITVKGLKDGTADLRDTAGKKHTFPIPFLVCLAFVGPPQDRCPEGYRWKAFLNPPHWESVRSAPVKRKTDKLDSAKAYEIKKLIAAGVAHPRIAISFGVSPHLISDIKRGRAWAHVSCP